MDPNARDLNEFNPATDLNHLRLLVDYKYCLTYKDYKEVSNRIINIEFIYLMNIQLHSIVCCLQYKGTEGTDSDDEEFENFSEYGKLVGKILSRRLYMVT